VDGRLQFMLRGFEEGFALVFFETWVPFVAVLLVVEDADGARRNRRAVEHYY
jgi:hypothetical protein